ncbi:Putative B3 domain-containing protein At2g27410 [Linum grandiflorum]
MSLPKYYFLSEKTVSEREQDPEKFERKVAEIKRSILEWDTDGGYVKLIQEAREEAADVSGDETAAEHIFIEKLSHMAAERCFELEHKRKENEEVEERERKLAEKESKEAEEAELRRWRIKQGTEPALPVGKRKRKKTKKIEEAEEVVEEGEGKLAEEEGLRRRKKQRKAAAVVAAAAAGKRQRKKSAGKIDFAAIGLDPPPRGFAEVIKERNDGVWDVKLVIMKELFSSDLTDNHGRLSMPELQIVDRDFITAEEKALISERNPVGIPVKLIGPTEDETTNVMLKRWTMNKSSMYVLNGGWRDLKEKFPEVLRKGAIFQVWSFRTANGDLRFQLHEIKHPHAGSESGSEDQPVEFASGLGGGGQ